MNLRAWWLWCLSPLVVTGLAAVEVKPVTIPATLQSFSLQFSRSPNQEEGNVTLQVVAVIPDGQLLGWRDVHLIEATDLDGRQLGEAIPDQDSAPIPNHGESEDDLNHPVSLSFAIEARPPNGLKSLRVAATAIIASGAHQFFVLPPFKQNASFAPADQPTASATYVRAQGDQIYVTVSSLLLDRIIRISGRGPDGEVECNSYLNNPRGTGRELILSPQNAAVATFQPVLEVANHIERRPVILVLENQDFYASSTEPVTLIPLQNANQSPATVETVEINPDQPQPVIIPMPPKF